MRGLSTIASAFTSLADGFSMRYPLNLFILFFIGISSGLSAQTPPEYTWIDKEDLPTVTVTNTDDLTISIATDPQGNVYTLSFGNGVDKRDADGGLIEAGFISGDDLDSPLDIAIDEEGYIYIADFLAQGSSYEDNGKIKVFDPQGNYLPQRTILTSFYRPLGVDVSSDKVYVAEFNDATTGPEQDNQLSRIRVYDKNMKTVLRETDQVEIPYRIAVNSEGLVYVSQAGNNDPDVLIFDANFNLIGKLPNIISPGSVVVDNLDYVHVIEYKDRIDFSEFINFAELGFTDILEIAGQIKRGSDNEEFLIKIFSPANVYLSSEVHNIDFPVDLAFNGCDRMYVNNATVFGSNIIFVGFVPSRMEFDLEIYERTPSFDVQSPTVLCIPERKEFTLENGEVSITPDEIDDGSTDNCGIAAMTLSQSTFTNPGDYSISLTVTDLSGNTNSCTTSITILTPVTELSVGCPNDQLEHKNENCQFVVPDYTSMANPSNPDAIITQFPVEGTVIEEDTEVTLTATFGDLTASCSFQLEIIDRTHVVFNCPGNQTDTYDQSEGYQLPDYANEVQLQDNCDPNPLITQDPLPGTVITEEETEIVLRVEDAAGNVSVCSFKLFLTDVSEPLQFTSCPQNQEGNFEDNCRFSLPDYTALATTNSEEAMITQFPVPGTIIDADTKIVLTATLNGESVSCEFQLNLVDDTPPVMECFTSITGVYDSSKGFELQDYGRNISIQDNCDSAPVITQDPPEGTLIYVDESTITFTATDASGNTSTCTVDLVLTDVPESLRFTACPDTQVEELDANCQFVIPDYTQAAETNYPDAEITQDPPAGQLVQGKAAIQVYLTATRGDEMVKCRVPLQVVDLLPPDMLCPGDQVDSYDPAEGFLIPDYSSLAQGEDNCGELIVSQNPPEGTVVFGDTPIQLNFRDPSGNWTFCNFRLLLEEIEGPTFDCPNPGELPKLELNEECKVETPDFRDLLSGFAGFENEPHFVQTEEQDGNTLSVHIEVYDGEGGNLVGDCNFDISLLDTTPPEIACSESTFRLSPDENGKYILPDFSNWTSDTCDSNLEVVQDPPPGEITAGGTVSFFAVDDSGNTSQTCSFEVVLVQEGEPSFDCHEFDAVPQIAVNEDCSIGNPDFADLVSNFQNFKDSPLIFQSLQISGKTLLVHIEVYDGEQKQEFLVGECNFEIQLTENIAPEAVCIQEITVTLGEDGTAMITPEDIDNGSTDGCGIVSYELSRDTFTVDDVGNGPIEVELKVTDDYENTDSCTVLVTVEPHEPTEPGAVICETSITLPLNANGEAQLDLEQLYEGELGPGGTVAVDKQVFTCDDLGVQTVRLQYSGTSTGSCSIEVNVVDEIAPTPMVKDIDISLDENGAASITAEDINNGSTDNCGASTLQFSLGQSSFNCSDVGSNSIRFTVTDSSGNSASAEANVFVSDPSDNCVVDPVVPPEDRFVVLFPNPSRGQVQIATSADIVLDRVEIFDTRGRFLDARELKRNPATRSYHLDLEKYQTGVYTLKIYTEEREYIRRAIITTF